MGIGGLFKNGFKTAADIGKAGIRYSIPGMLDESIGAVFGQAFKGVAGGVSGIWDGLIGKNLNLTNASGIGKVTKALGYGAGKLSTGVTKPLMWAGKNLVKNTPADAAYLANASRKIFNMGFKKTGSTGANALFGYEARGATPWLLTAGAVGYGATQSMGEERFNLGLRSVVNGVMDTEGVAITPGMVNQSYTPVRGRPINNHGATGELGLALHRNRNTGYL